jgi:hypothetical protein
VGNAAKWVAEILVEEGNQPKRADKRAARGKEKKVQAGNRSAKK